MAREVYTAPLLLVVPVSTEPYVWSVPSRSHPGQLHTVTWDEDSQQMRCSCPAGEFRNDCAHRAAVVRTLAAKFGGEG